MERKHNELEQSMTKKFLQSLAMILSLSLTIPGCGYNSVEDKKDKNKYIRIEAESDRDSLDNRIKNEFVKNDRNNLQDQMDDSNIYNENNQEQNQENNLTQDQISESNNENGQGQAQATSDPSQTSKPSETINPSRPNKSSQPTTTSRPNQSNRPNQTSRPEQTILPNQTSKPNQTSQPSQTSRPNQTSKPGETSKPNQTGRPSQGNNQGYNPTPTPGNHGNNQGNSHGDKTCDHTKKTTTSVLTGSDKNFHYFDVTTSCLVCDTSITTSIKEKHQIGEYRSNGEVGEIANCNICDWEFTRDHSYILEKSNYVKNADGTYSKVDTYVCTRDNQTKDVVTPHTHVDNWVSNGETNEKSSCVCGNVSTRDHDYKLIRTTYRKNSDGSYSQVDTYRCTRDNQTKDVVTPHTHVDNWVSNGEINEKSSCVCGYETTRNHDYKLIGTTYIKNSDGSYSQVDTYECPRDHQIKVVITKHTHNYNEWKSISDLKEESTCVCGEKTTRNHPFGPWVNNGDYTETHTCPSCGHSVTRTIPHDCQYGAWENYTDAGAYKYCILCGDEIYHGHSYSTEWNKNPEGFKEYPCTVDGCNHKKTVTCDHRYEPQGDKVVDPSTDEYCTKQTYKCRDCGNEYIEYGGHSFSDVPDAIMDGQACYYCTRSGCYAYKIVPYTDSSVDSYSLVLDEEKEEQKVLIK